MIGFVRRALRGPLQRSAVAVALALVLMAGGHSDAFARDELTCAGKSILPDLAAKHPEIHREVMEKARKTANAEAILWRVSKPDQPDLKPSYLFGTMHVTDKRITELPEAVNKALTGASTVALEVADLSPTAMMMAIGSMPQLIVYTDGSQLESKLAPKEFEEVVRIVGAGGLPPQMASLVRPWLVMTLLATPDCEQKRVAGGKKVLDSLVGELAKKHKIPLVGLETIEAQLKAMAGVPDKDQIGLLKLSLVYVNQREDQFETLIQAYQKRQLGIPLHISRALAKMAGITEHGIEAFEREVVVKRNHTMFETSQPLVDKGNAFIAVGALHLVGETGLVALYRKAGFTVQPVL